MFINWISDYKAIGFVSLVGGWLRQSQELLVRIDQIFLVLNKSFHKDGLCKNSQYKCYISGTWYSSRGTSSSQLEFSF